MANGAATQGLSTALAPPASTSSGGGSSNTRNSGSGADRGAVAGRGGGRGAGGGRGGSSSSRENASQHTISVSLGKAWLEILVKLMRRASTAREGVAVGGFGGLASGNDVITAALADVGTRDALLALFERTAAGVAAAAAAAAAGGGGGGGAAAGAVDEEHDSEVKKTPSWADPALVLRSFVLLREVLERVPEAYVVPLRRRGVLHRWAEG